MIEAAPPSRALLALRLVLWTAIVAVWWFQGARLREKDGVLDRESQRVRLTQEITELERTLRRTLSFLPQSAREDASWWQHRLAEGMRAHSLEPGPFTTAPTRHRVGSHALLQLSTRVTGSYAQIVQFLAWVEAASPRARPVAADVAPCKEGLLAASLTLLVPVLSPGQAGSAPHPPPAGSARPVSQNPGGER